MKSLILSLLLVGCVAEKKSDQAKNSIIEENDACICTEEYNPVCGSDGVTYSNACHAGCKKQAFTPGECSK